MQFYPQIIDSILKKIYFRQNLFRFFGCGIFTPDKKAQIMDEEENKWAEESFWMRDMGMGAVRVRFII